MARLVIYVGLCVTAALLAGCGSAQSEVLGRFELSGVAVEVSYTPEGPSGQAITVRFDPGDGFHLYAASMPAGGIDGIGDRRRSTSQGATSSPPGRWPSTCPSSCSMSKASGSRFPYTPTESFPSRCR
jgi:hypothetical protein